MLKHDEINIVKDFDHCLLNQIANSFDLGDFRQILLYFGLSTWIHIEYRIKRSTVTYTCFCFFGFKICIPFFVRKNQLSIKQFFGKKRARWPYCFYWLVEFSIIFPAIYVNIKNNLAKIKKLSKTSLKQQKKHWSTSCTYTFNKFVQVSRDK